MEPFAGRLALQQRVLPVYRAPFFDLLADACREGLSVIAGEPRREEAIAVTEHLEKACLVRTHNWHLFRGPFYSCWQTGLRAWLADWQPSALIVEANPRYLSTGQAIAWMHARRLPVLGWGLGAPPISGAMAAWREGSRRKFLQQFDALITYSRKGAAEYRAIGFPAQRIFVAPNAVTGRPRQPAPQRPQAFSGQPVVLFVGRLQARKRIDLLLQACAALPARLQPRLWIVGDGPARLELETLAGQIYPSAEFLGARQGAELEPYFRGADLFVLPGTGGLAVQEAMAYGLPVVVGQADGTQVDLVRPENGWLVSDSLAGILEEALSSPARLRQMGAASYRIVAEEINLEKMVAVFLNAVRAAQAAREAI